jgi:hypothetical protein
VLHGGLGEVARDGISDQSIDRALLLSGELDVMRLIILQCWRSMLLFVQLVMQRCVTKLMPGERRLRRK